MAGQLRFGKLAEYYDRIYARKEYAREASDLLRIARRFLRRQPHSLLDVACGTGRHLAEFARTMSVTGVDLNAPMLTVARRRLGRRVPLHRADMRRFRLTQQFDVVTCLFSAVGELESRHDRDAACANFYRHLVPGGVALVEGWVLPSRWRGRSVHLDTHCDQKIAIARAASSRRVGNHSVVEFQYLVAESGRKIRHYTEVMRNPLVGADEMLDSFRRAGFRARVLLGGSYRDRGLYVGVRPP